jgi:uncharacterized iron-regulated membrane protein
LKIRKIIARMHLWLSLLVGIFIIAITLSGTILVFRSEIEHNLYANLYRGTPGILRMDDIKRAVLKRYPGQKIDTIARQLGDTVYEVRTQGDNPLYVYVDAGSGKVLGARHPDESFLGMVDNFHTQLFLGDVGRPILGTIGLCFLLMLLTGGYLWWPGIKKWALGFTVRLRKRAWFLRHYDLHKFVGLCALPFLTMIVIAGISFCFTSQVKAIWYELTFARSTTPIQLKSIVPDQDAKSLDADTLLAKASAAVPGGILTEVIMPSKKTAAEQIRFSLPYDPRAGSGFDGQVRVYLDQYSGNILWNTDPRKLSLSENIYENWRFALHIGSYGNLVTRVLQVIVGVTPTFLAITGISMWYLKRSAKKKRKNAQKIQVEVGAEAARV